MQHVMSDSEQTLIKQDGGSARNVPETGFVSGFICGRTKIKGEAHEVSWTSLDVRQCAMWDHCQLHKVGIRLSQPTEREREREIQGRYRRESEWDYANYLGERVQEKYM